MTDDLDDLLARIDALDEEPPPDDEWEWAPDQEEQMALLDADDDDEPVEPLDRPSLDEFDLMYAVAVIRGLVRPHRELTDAEEIEGRRALAECPEMLIALRSDPDMPDAMRVRGYQGSLGYRWL